MTKTLDERQFQLLLNRKEDFTIEELRNIGCFEGYSDERLAELLDTIKRFTKITLKSMKSRKNNASF
ncbi:MAG TPA: hypothetical protein VL098_00625 [Flavipsychrobacter sp.]|nr:hypothetical protein [Flavipsychrobacter sp.]